jgi:hypothetical protein
MDRKADLSTNLRLPYLDTTFVLGKLVQIRMAGVAEVSSQVKYHTLTTPLSQYSKKLTKLEQSQPRGLWSIFRFIEYRTLDLEIGK